MVNEWHRIECNLITAEKQELNLITSALLHNKSLLLRNFSSDKVDWKEFKLNWSRMEEKKLSKLY